LSLPTLLLTSQGLYHILTPSIGKQRYKDRVEQIKEGGLEKHWVTIEARTGWGQKIFITLFGVQVAREQRKRKGIDGVCRYVEGHGRLR
jgi:hypothetical protein